jgi:hypothetical protein
VDIWHLLKEVKGWKMYFSKPSSESCAFELLEAYDKYTARLQSQRELGWCSELGPLKFPWPSEIQPA